MTARGIIDLMGLEPLPKEGGWFRRIHTSALPHGDGRALASAIHYLIAGDVFSAMHRLPSEEVFHFYEGHAADLLLLQPDGTGEIIRMGPNIEAGERRTAVVPGGTWQGLRLAPDAPGDAWALFGVSVHPEFRWEEFEIGHAGDLIASHPVWTAEIQRRTRS